MKVPVIHSFYCLTWALFIGNFLSSLSATLLLWPYGNLSSFLNLVFALQNSDAKAQVCGIVIPHLQGLADRHLSTPSLHLLSSCTMVMKMVMGVTLVVMK